ncbi:MAG: hypothetical protein Q8M25_24985 [Rhodoferax sp.]|nr:hypothetical protein [Rhodoferax sp.]
MTDYQYPKFERLEPRTPFKGGRISETDPLTLSDAARFASVHAGSEITPADFLRAAGRGEITMRAIVHQTAKLQKIGGGVYCNAGQPNENTAPKRSILSLPLSACQQLAATGRASWREFESFKSIDGILMRYVIAELTPDEPDFETTPDDCRVTGNAVNALADAFIDTAAPAQTATPAPVEEIDYSLLATPAELLDAFGKWGMKAAWFDDLNSRKWLLDARRKKGQGTQGQVIPPLFCPFAVMNGLIGKVRRTNRLKPDTAWRTLAHKFPNVYAAFESHDPRDQTGD